MFSLLTGTFNNGYKVWVAGASRFSGAGLNQMTKAFEIGKTYSTRSACDHDCIFSFTITARTAKQVTTTVHGKTVRRGVSVYCGVEQFKPFGSYSMAAIISADDRVAV